MEAPLFEKFIVSNKWVNSYNNITKILVNARKQLLHLSTLKKAACNDVTINQIMPAATKTLKMQETFSAASTGGMALLTHPIKLDIGHPEIQNCEI